MVASGWAENEIRIGGLDNGLVGDYIVGGE